MSLNILKLFIVIIPLVITPYCQILLNFCYHCNILTNICVICEYPDILIPDKNGGCIGAKKCISGKNNCNECDEKSEYCKTCDENYYPDENGGCSYTKDCKISYLGKCLQCKEGSVLIGNELKLCKSLSMDSLKNCKEIDYKTGYCSVFNEGYKLTSIDYNCINVENCKESLFGNCISCNYGYYLNKKEGKCIKKTDNLLYCKQSLDGKNCEICDDNYHFDENGICVKTQFCAESENLICKKCISGYYKIKNYPYISDLWTNTDNCHTADEFTSICTSCNNGYYLDFKDYKCKSNLEDGPFKYCELVENGLWKKCEYEYYLGEDMKCSSSFICSESENGNCKECQKNYYLTLDNICSEVKGCIHTLYNSCVECEDGYYYHKKNKTCIEMQDQFLGCKSSCISDSNKCCECKKDFYLFENDSLCYDNTKVGPFTKCALVDHKKEHCMQCIDGYFLGTDDYKCTKVENCRIVENENKCAECDEYYCLDVKKQICAENEFLSEKNDKIHISCNKTNEEGTACAQCIDGYKLNEEGYCVGIDVCEEKENGKCKKCKDIIKENGYEYCANEIFGCLESVSKNCLRCNNLTDLYQCTEYNEGYHFDLYNFCIEKE